MPRRNTSGPTNLFLPVIGSGKEFLQIILISDLQKQDDFFPFSRSSRVSLDRFDDSALVWSDVEVSFPIFNLLHPVAGDLPGFSFWVGFFDQFGINSPRLRSSSGWHNPSGIP